MPSLDSLTVEEGDLLVTSLDDDFLCTDVIRETLVGVFMLWYSLGTDKQSDIVHLGFEPLLSFVKGDFSSCCCQLV